MKCVYTAPNASMVYLLKDLLAERGIETVVHGEGLLGAAGELAPVDAWVELKVVEDADEAAARRQIESFLQLSKQSAAESWQCDQCKVEVEGQFGACWQCGLLRE